MKGCLCLCVPLLSAIAANAAPALPSFILSERSEVVLVKPDGTAFERRVHVVGITLEQAHSFIIPYSQLEPLTDVEGSYTDEKGRSVRIKKGDLRDGALLPNAFYDDQRARFVDLPPGRNFQLDWVQTCAMPMLFGGVDTAPEPMPLQWSCTIHVPLSIRLCMALPDPMPPGLQLSVDSTDMKERTYRFTRGTQPPSLEVDDAGNLEKDHGRTFVRMELMPAGTAIAPFAYLNAWYTTLVSEVPGLDVACGQWVDSLVAGAVSEDERIARIFQAVRQRVDYLAIEDAMNGVRPRPPATTWAMKKGDCKDMALLLVNALQHVRIDARLAIASTIHHAVDLDFASVGSADHVICIIPRPPGWLFLDATETACRYGWPSRQIQGRHILPVGREDVALVQVPIVPPDSNVVHMDIDLMWDGHTLKGTCRTEMRGMAAWPYTDLAASNTPDAVRRTIQDRFSARCPALTTGEPVVNVSDGVFAWHAPVSSSSMLTRAGSSTYLSLGIMPMAHGLPLNVPDGTFLPIGEAMLRTVRMHVSMNGLTGWKLPPVADIAENGITFHLEATEPVPGELLITYTYRCPYVRIDRTDKEAYTHVNAFITQIQNRSLVHAQH